MRGIGIIGDRRTGLVTMTMRWDEARDFGDWLVLEGGDESLGKDLLKAAREAVGL